MPVVKIQICIFAWRRVNKLHWACFRVKFRRLQAQRTRRQLQEDYASFSLSTIRTAYREHLPFPSMAWVLSLQCWSTYCYLAPLLLTIVTIWLVSLSCLLAHVYFSNQCPIWASSTRFYVQHSGLKALDQLCFAGFVETYFSLLLLAFWSSSNSDLVIWPF